MAVRSPFRPWLPWLVLVTCGVLTAVGSLAIVASTRARDNQYMDVTARDLAASIDSRVETYLALLRSATALFVASDGVTREDFGRYVSQLDLRERFRGMQGIGYAPRVGHGDLDRLERNMQSKGTDFDVWPKEPARSVYTPIVFIEPLDLQNREAVGFDMFSEATRRAAMERAAVEARAIASGRVTLVQERTDPSKTQAGFLIYVPMYRRNHVPTDPADRLAAVEGYVYAPFRAGDFLGTIVRGETRRPVRLRLFDGEAADPARLLYDSDAGSARESAGPLEVTRGLQVAGRHWTMVVTAHPELSSSSPWLLPVLYAFGAGLSVLLFVLTRAEARARAEAERAAGELRRSEHALQAASRAKDEFLATLSHELRTPLNAILGWTRMLRTGQLDAARQEAALAVVERNARAQAQLVEDILDVSRIITGKLRLDLAVVAVNPIVEEAVASVRPAADAKGVDLQCLLDPEAGTIVAAADRVQQVAWNLLSNAIKFTPQGGQVRITTVRRGSEVRLTVADDGAGIAPAFLPHVFDRFTQADSSTTRTHSGVGLGLAIVRHIVELHGGTIEAESEGPGRGATFTAAFPAKVLPHVDRGPGAPAANEPHERALAHVSAVVVDDDADARHLVATALALEGAQVREAATVGEALEAVSTHGADVIVSDLAMPVEDGYALVRRLRDSTVERLRSIPVIALTAYARRGDREGVLSHGFQGFVAKPVDLRVLVEQILGVLHASHGR